MVEVEGKTTCQAGDRNIHVSPQAKYSKYHDLIQLYIYIPLSSGWYPFSRACTYIYI